MLDQLRVKAAGQTLDHKARAVFALQRNMNQSQHVMNRPSGVQAAALPLQVGQVIGGASVGTPSSRTESPAGMEFSQHSSTVDVDNLFSDKVYINNSLNRKLGRVGKLMLPTRVGSRVGSSQLLSTRRATTTLRCLHPSATTPLFSDC